MVYTESAGKRSLMGTSLFGSRTSSVGLSGRLRPGNPLFTGLNWRAAAWLLPSVAVYQIAPIYRELQALPGHVGLRPQAPEKKRFFADFSV
jgi:hypothetical protein